MSIFLVWLCNFCVCRRIFFHVWLKSFCQHIHNIVHLIFSIIQSKKIILRIRTQTINRGIILARCISVYRTSICLYPAFPVPGNKFDSTFFVIIHGNRFAIMITMKHVVFPVYLFSLWFFTLTKDMHFGLMIPVDFLHFWKYFDTKLYLCVEIRYQFQEFFFIKLVIMRAARMIMLLTTHFTMLNTFR